MNRTTRTVTLDVSRENNFAYYAKQADALSRFLKIRFAEGGNDINLSPTDKVTLTVERADGRKVVGLGSVASDGTATVEFTSSMLAVVGEGECEVSVTGENGFVLTTLSFVLYVEKKLCDDNAIESSNEFPVFMQALAEMAKLERDINDAATDALKGKMTYRGEVEALPENAASGDVYKVKNHIYRDGYCRVMLDYPSIESIDDNTHRLYFAEDTLLFRALRCAYEAHEGTGCALELVSGGKAYTLTWVGIGNGYIDVSAQSDATVYLDIFPDEYGFIKVPLQYAESDVAVYTASILVPEGGVAVYDSNGWITITAESLVDLMAEVKVLEDALAEAGNSSGGGGGFRKIGFTADCDFVATAEDGLTAFKDALEAASDGETFYVMPGTYVSTETLTIAKNLNFIGVGMPVIEFPISVHGDGEYELGGGIITPIVTYTTNWSGITFENQVTAFYTQSYASPLAFSSVNSVNCSFNGIGNRFMGSHFKSSFMFDFEEDYYRVTLGGEFDYLGSTFENCDLIFKTGFDGLFSAKKCNMFFNMKNPAYTGESSYIFEHCNIYNYGNYVVNNGQYSSNFIVSNCNIFGSTFFSEATASGNYLISGTAL